MMWWHRHVLKHRITVVPDKIYPKIWMHHCACGEAWVRVMQ